jgi:transposase InsO family protein/bacterioferritin (cytochrome b1)
MSWRRGKINLNSINNVVKSEDIMYNGRYENKLGLKMHDAFRLNSYSSDGELCLYPLKTTFYYNSTLLNIPVREDYAANSPSVTEYYKNFPTIAESLQQKKRLTQHPTIPTSLDEPRYPTYIRGNYAFNPNQTQETKDKAHSTFHHKHFEMPTQSLTHTNKVETKRINSPDNVMHYGCKQTTAILDNCNSMQRSRNAQLAAPDKRRTIQSQCSVLASSTLDSKNINSTIIPYYSHNVLSGNKSIFPNVTNHLVNDNKSGVQHVTPVNSPSHVFDPVTYIETVLPTRSNPAGAQEPAGREFVDVNALILTTVDACKLSDKINKQIKTETIRDLGLKKLIYTGKNQPDYTLDDVFEAIFSTKTTGEKQNLTIFPSLHINVQIPGISKKLMAILDSGANHCAINHDLVTHYKIEQGDTPLLFAANNQKINILGTVEIPIQIGENTFVTKFLVVKNLAAHIILGNIFLLRHQIEISYRTKQIRIGNSQVIDMDEKWYLKIENPSLVLTTLDKQDDIVEIRTEQKFTLKPRQHVKIKLLDDQTSEYVFEQNLCTRDRLKIYAYVTEDWQDNNKKYIQVYNASTYARVLKENTLLGYLKRVHKHDSSLKTDTVKPQDLKTKDTPSNIFTVESYGKGKIILFDKNGDVIQINNQLTVDQHNKVVNVLSRFTSMFTNRLEDVTECKVEPIRIKLKQNSKPILCRPYRQSHSERQILDQEIQKLLKAGILQEMSEYSVYQSPIFIVTNKDKSNRLISDFRAVNSQIEPENHPIPSLDMILSSLAGMKWFSSIDIKSSFFAIPVHPDDRHLLTVITETNKYSFTRLPQGMNISTAVFQRCLTKILSKHLYQKCNIYVDDTQVFSIDFDSQLTNLEAILEDLDKHNLKLNTNKCKLFMTTLNVLGHEVNQFGIKPMSSSVDAVNKIKQPRTIKDVRSVLGFFSFFRKFIKNFSLIALPLTNCIKNYNKSKMLNWDQSCEDSLNTFKRILTNPPLLKHFQIGLETRIYTDASNDTIGAALIQVDEDGIEHPIQYLSKKLPASKVSLSVSEKEFTSLVHACLTWRPFIFGQVTKVYTDHAPLLAYQSFKNLSSRLTRLALQLTDFQLEIHYKKGSQMTLADFLSRQEDCEEMDPTILGDTLNIILQVDLSLLQQQQEDLKKIMDIINNPGAATKKEKLEAEDYFIKNNILYRTKDHISRQYTIVIPNCLTKKIIENFHDSPMEGAHLHAQKTFDKIQERYYWKHMRKQVEEYVKTCILCQKRKIPPKRKLGLLQPISPTLRPFSRLQLDFIGPICSSYGKEYILTITCVATKFAFTYALKTADAQSVAKCLLDLITKYGMFSIIQSDKGTTFTSQVIQKLILALGACQIFSSAYMPQINGQVECYNKILIQMLSNYVQEKPSKWLDYLGYVTFAYNNTKHDTTTFTPSYLFLGFKPLLITDTFFVTPNMDRNLLENIRTIENVRQTVPEIIKNAQEKQKKYFDRHRRNFDFKAGDEVLLYYPKNLRNNKTKFSQRYRGPFTVLRKVNPSSYEIEMINNNKLVKDVVHIARMKLYNRRT